MKNETEKKDMRVVRINDVYALVDAPWCSHRRSKNYAAVITGLDPRYGYKRDFLKKGFGGGYYVFPEKPKAGDIVEVVAIYFTGGGHGEKREGSGFYRLNHYNDNMSAVFERVPIIFSYADIQGINDDTIVVERFSIRLDADFYKSLAKQLGIDDDSVSCRWIETLNFFKESLRLNK